MSPTPHEKPRDWMEQLAAVIESERDNVHAFIARLDKQCIPYQYSDGRITVESRATREKGEPE